MEFSALGTTQENTEGDNIDGLSYNDTRNYASNSNIVRLSDYVHNSSNIITDTDSVRADQGLFPSVISTALSLEHFETPVTIAPVVGKGLDPSARLDVT